MGRFDLYSGKNYIDYYVNIQSPFHEVLKTRMVIPILAKRKVINLTKGLQVPVLIDDAPYYVITPMMGAVPARELGKQVGNLTEYSHDITAAIDFLLQGF